MPAKKAAVFHVGLAKCASTFIQDQTFHAASAGKITASVWGPYDGVLNHCFREVMGAGIVAFPEAKPSQVPIDANKPYVATNECLTGHFPQPLRLMSHPTFTGEQMKAVQQRVALELQQFARTQLPQYDAKILMVVRNPKAWLSSLYRNFVIMGVSQEPEEFLECFSSAICQWANVGYLAELYRGMFGADKVLILPMEMLRNENTAFFKHVNDWVGADVMVNNNARNTGFSDSATETFRQFWKQLDAILPPEPSWDSNTVKFKQNTWNFLHNCIMNDEVLVKRANNVWGEKPFQYGAMPAKVVKQIQESMEVVKNIKVFAPYLDDYFAA